jgi:excisionase family DNA binding protein
VLTVYRIDLFEMDTWTEMNWTTLLNVREAAELLGVTPRTVYGLVSQGRLPVYRDGWRLFFFELELLERALQRKGHPSDQRDLKRLQ